VGDAIGEMIRWAEVVRRRFIRSIQRLAPLGLALGLVSVGLSIGKLAAPSSINVTVNVPATLMASTSVGTEGPLGTMVVVLEPSALVQFRMPVATVNRVPWDARGNAVTWELRDSHARLVAASAKSIPVVAALRGQPYVAIELVAPATVGDWLLQMYWQTATQDHAAAASMISSIAFATSDLGHHR
jgi:hypothetical protein